MSTIEKLGGENYRVISGKIPDSLSLEEVSEGGLCGGCQGPMHKTYITWAIPTFDGRNKIIFRVSNVVGYSCDHGCKLDSPSHEGLVQLIDYLLPKVDRLKLGKTAHGLRWTKAAIENYLLPE